MTRILFVHPFHLTDSALEREWLTPYPPLGLLYLAAIAREAGDEVAVYDGTFQNGTEVFGRALAKFEPEVVCLGSLITMRPTALGMAALAHEHGAWVVVGGPDPTAHPDAYLAPKGADVVIRGEAEDTLLQVLKTGPAQESLVSVAGVAFRARNGNIIRTPARAVRDDLDALPFPARELVNVEVYFDIWRKEHGYTSLTLAASRGCPEDCEHCRQAGRSGRHRVRSPDSVAAEMKRIQDAYSPDRFRLVDDLDGLGEEWLRSLAASMQAQGVAAPYEGLRLHQALGELPLLARTKELCADRNAWIPKAAPHPHAPPALDEAALQERWRDAYVPPGVTLPDP